MSITLHSEAWRTTRIAGESAGFLQLRGLRPGSPGLDKVLEADSAAKGFPMKEITTIRTKSGGAGETTVSSTTEVHDVKSVTAPTALFTVPPGYKKKR